MISLANPMELQPLRTDSPTRCGTELALLVWRRLLASAPRPVGSRNGRGGEANGIPPERFRGVADRLALAVDRAWLGIEIVLGGRRFHEALLTSPLRDAGGLLVAIRTLLASVSVGPLDQGDRESVRNAWLALEAARRDGYLAAYGAELAPLLEQADIPIDPPDAPALSADEAGALDRLGERCEAAGREGLCPLLRLRWKGQESLAITLVAALLRYDYEANPPAHARPPLAPSAGRPAANAGTRSLVAEMLVRHEAQLARLLDELRPNDRGDDTIRDEIAPPKHDPAEKLREGRAHLRGGQYDSAASAFAEAARLSPACVEAHVLRAEAHRHRGEYAHALAALHEAHALAPASAAILFDRGVVLGLLGRPDDAIDDFSAALRRDPTHSLAYLRRAGAYLERGRREPALKDLTHALRLDPECGLAYQMRGDLLALEGRFDQAIGDYTQVIRRTPCCADGHLRRGDAYRAKREGERAIADYTQALRLDPLHAPAYLRRAAGYNDDGRYALAVADLNSAARLEPDGEQIYHLRGLALREMGDPASALADFDRALRLHPAARHHYERGRTHELQQQADAALDDYDAAIGLEPASPAYRRARGALLLRRGRVDPAIDDFTEAIRLDASVADAHVERAAAWIEKGRFDRAVEDCASALACDPRSASAFATRGKAHAQQGDYSSAEADFDRALALAPRDAHAYRLRAEAAIAQGEYEKALRDLRRSLELNPASAVALHLGGTALQGLGRGAEALDEFNKAMLLDPRYTAAYCNQRALLHAYAGEYGPALADYAIVLQIDPCNLTAVAGRERVQAALLAAPAEVARSNGAAPPAKAKRRIDPERRAGPRTTPPPPTMVRPAGLETQNQPPVPVEGTPGGGGPVAEFVPEDSSYFQPEPELEIPPPAAEILPDRAEAPPPTSLSSEPAARSKPTRSVGPLEARAAKESRKEEMEERAHQWAEKVHRERQEMLGTPIPAKHQPAKRPAERGPLAGILLKVAIAVALLGSLGFAGFYSFQAREARLDSVAVWEEFAADSEATSQKYKGRFVQVTGKIKSYPVGKASRFFFEIPKGANWGIECTLRPADSKDLKDGQTITVRGRLTPRPKKPDSNVSISNCNLLKREP